MTSFTFFLFFIPVLALLLLAINFLLAPYVPNAEKRTAFECGFHSFLGQNRSQFNISFFIFALLFLLFDLEILLIYPYALSSTWNDLYGLSIMLIFFILLTIGFIFELGKKALTIYSRQNKTNKGLGKPLIKNTINTINILYSNWKAKNVLLFNSKVNILYSSIEIPYVYRIIKIILFYLIHRFIKYMLTNLVNHFSLNIRDVLFYHMLLLFIIINIVNTVFVLIKYNFKLPKNFSFLSIFFKSFFYFSFVFLLNNFDIILSNIDDIIGNCLGIKGIIYYIKDYILIHIFTFHMTNPGTDPDVVEQSEVEHFNGLLNSRTTIRAQYLHYNVLWNNNPDNQDYQQKTKEFGEKLDNIEKKIEEFKEEKGFLDPEDMPDSPSSDN